jgi:ribosome hibernation promoting factor
VIQKFEVTGVHFTIDAELRAEIDKKLGNLDHYIPLHSRPSAHLEVFLRELKLDGKRQAVCEANLYLPHETINLTEKAGDMKSAVEIVHSRLKLQIQKYKTEHMVGKQRRHIIGRIQRNLATRFSRGR